MYSCLCFKLGSFFVEMHCYDNHAVICFSPFVASAGLGRIMAAKRRKSGNPQASRAQPNDWASITASHDGEVELGPAVAVRLTKLVCDTCVTRPRAVTIFCARAKKKCAKKLLHGQRLGVFEAVLYHTLTSQYNHVVLSHSQFSDGVKATPLSLSLSLSLFLSAVLFKCSTWLLQSLSPVPTGPKNNYSAWVIGFDDELVAKSGYNYQL